MFRLLLFLLLLNVGYGFGQKVDSTCVRETMNHYVSFVNDNIRLLYLYHSQLEQFNRDLNRFYEASPSERENLRLVFSSQNLLTEANGFGDFLPNERFQLISAKYTCIPSPYRDPTHKLGGQLKDIVGEIAGLSERLALYVRSQTYRDEPELRTAYAIMNRCHVLFHDFGSIKDGLYYELNKLYRNFENPSAVNTYMLSTRSLMRVIVPMRSILAGLKQDKPQRVSNNIPRLENAIGRAENEMESLLATLDPVRQEKARGQFFYFTEVAGDFGAASKEYTQSDAYDEDYAQYGKSYYYYNNRLLNIFNNYGEGLAQRYNALVEDADIILLKTVEATPWFKVVQPGPRRQDTVVEEEPVVATASPLPDVNMVAVPSLEGAPANNLVFLLDVSKSMEQPDRLPMLKTSMKQMLEYMRPQDRVAVVTYSGEAKVVLPSTSATEIDRITQAIDNLQSGGRTNALNGAVAAYRVAQRAFTKEGNNRIIMASDGYFRIPEALPRLVKEKAGDNILLSIFFFGEEKEEVVSRLIRLADLGDGNYRHITPENVDDMLLEESAGDD
jgi:hypothetical protein